MVVAAALFAGVAHAENARQATGRCTKGERTALEEVGCAIATYIGTPTRGPVLVAAAAVIADRSLERPEELATRIARVTAGQLGPKAQFAEGPLSLGAARAAAQSAGSLVYVSARLEHGKFRATFDLYPVPNGFWDRVRTSSPNPVRHGFVERDLDPELMSFFPPIPLVSSRVDRAAAASPAVALACGDVEGDGPALVWVDRYRVSVARIQTERLVPVRSADWRALSPVAPAPLRQPIGTAATARDRVWVGLSDRRDGLRLGADLTIQERLPGSIPWANVGCLATEATALGEARPCPAGNAHQVRSHLAPGVDAIASGQFRDASGAARQLFAWRDAETTVVQLLDDRGAGVEAGRSGAQLAVGDLDRDGQPELLTSADTLDPAGDALIVRTWQRDGHVVERFRLAVPSGVHGLAVCPAVDSGLSPVVIAAGDGVWVLQ